MDHALFWWNTKGPQVKNGKPSSGVTCLLARNHSSTAGQETGLSGRDLPCHQTSIHRDNLELLKYCLSRVIDPRGIAFSEHLTRLSAASPRASVTMLSQGIYFRVIFHLCCLAICFNAALGHISLSAHRSHDRHREPQRGDTLFRLPNEASSPSLTMRSEANGKSISMSPLVLLRC